MNNNPVIAQLGDVILRQPALPIDDFQNPKFHELITSMEKIMLESNGVGIAAPQIRISQQIIIIASRPTARYPNAPEMKPLVMVNPNFTALNDQMEKDWEGCLSVPGIRALVPRHTLIQVNYQNQYGDTLELLLEAFPARIFQHEFDHLLGLVYLDRVENNKDIYSETEFFKLIAA